MNVDLICLHKNGGYMELIAHSLFLIYSYLLKPLVS